MALRAVSPASARGEHGRPTGRRTRTLRSCLAALGACVLLAGSAASPDVVHAADAAPSPNGSPTASDSEPLREGVLLSRDELMALPTEGDAWRAVMARANQPVGGDYVLATRDDSNKDVFAAALAGARLDRRTLKTFVRDKIEFMMEAKRNRQDVLGTLRHLQTYVISADLIDLESFDPDLDARFRTWLAKEIRHEYKGGGGGGSVISTHEKKPNNFGTHAGATRLAAALYLGDEEEFRAARDIWYGWATGDPEFVPPGRVWTGTDWQCDPDRPAGINAEGCSRDGNTLDGVIPEDQERCGEYDWPPCETGYVHGAADGMTLAFWMMERQGEDPWEWGDQAALRQMQWKYEVDQLPYEGFRWQIPVIERVYDVDLERNDPAAASTNAGFADWWAQDPEGPPADGTDVEDAGLPVVAVVAIAAGGLLLLLVLVLAFGGRTRARPGAPPTGPAAKR